MSVKYINTTKAGIAYILDKLAEDNNSNQLKSIICLTFDMNNKAQFFIDITRLKGAEQYIPIGLLSRLTVDLGMCIDPLDADAAEDV